MRNASKILAGVGVVVGVVGLGILVGWWGSRQTTVPPVRPIAQPAPHPVQMAPNPAPLRPVPAVPSPGTSNRTAPPAVTPPPPVLAATNNVPAWEDKLDDILGSEEEDTNKVAQLFAMFPRLPEEGQEEVATHLSNLVPDEDYSKLGQMLLNPRLPEPVLDVLLSDALNRPDSVKLPLMLQIAQNPNHPKADEAKDLMELYLDEEDPAQWPQKLKEWLKENPD